jgi:hypothetical protein
VVAVARVLGGNGDWCTHREAFFVKWDEINGKPKGKKPAMPVSKNPHVWRLGWHPDQIRRLGAE